MQLKQNNTLRAEATVKRNQRGSRSSDGIMEQTKRGTKESWKRQWNKELTQGSGMKVDLYGTRPEGDVTKAAQIGNHVEIGNSSGIDWEERQLLNHEDESYAGLEGRWN